MRILIALLKCMRPKQWAKNGFVFTALIFDQQLLHLTPFLRTLAAFALFSLTASVVYILNDLVDMEADRLHPKKRNRPIASGALPVTVARWAAILLSVGIFPLAVSLSWQFALALACYLALNLAYSHWLKNIVIVDVFVLASFYVIRVLAGVEVIQVSRFSPWMYTFTVFLALFLGIGKRRAEVNLLVANANSAQTTAAQTTAAQTTAAQTTAGAEPSRRGSVDVRNSSGLTHRKVLQAYPIPLLDQYLNIISTLTIITYSLYTFSAPNLPENHVMMLTIPFVIYGIFRYLYLVQVEHLGGAPEDVAFTDRPIQFTLASFGLVILLIFYTI